MSLLRTCDAILMLPGWRRSRGSAAELAVAEKLGMVVLYSLTELGDWLEANR